MRCPCCGADTLTVPWHYDAATGTVSTSVGAVVIRGWKQREILAALASTPGRPLSRAQLVERVYQLSEEPDHAENSISVSITHMRPHLRAVGLEIRSNGTGRCASGYRLMLSEPGR